MIIVKYIVACDDEDAAVTGGILFVFPALSLRAMIKDRNVSTVPSHMSSNRFDSIL